MRDSEGVMRGAIQTQSESLMFFQPTVSAVILRKLQSYNPVEALSGDIRLINSEAPDWAFAKEQLGLTERQILKMPRAQQT